MSEHTLPEDLSRWPKNPFELLGVARNASQQEIRRAYTRLIRTYKPEQFPDHFRRIRDAYEAAKQSGWVFPAIGPISDPPPLGPEETQTGPKEPPAARPAPAKSDGRNLDRPTAPRPPTRSLEQELEEAWDWAIDGDEAKAYAALLDLRQRFPHRSEVCVRLYCLLHAAPELDTHRAPAEFLVQGMLLASGDAAIRSLYHREIELNPEEALTDRFAKLLGGTSQPTTLANFVRWRWGAAGRQQRLDVIADDLPGLRARLAIDHEEIWLRLLVTAAEQLTCRMSAGYLDLLEQCCNEVQRHEHLQLRLTDAFNRIEYLEFVSMEWEKLQSDPNLPVEVLTLLSLYWTRPFEELRRGVAEIVAEIAARPQAWLVKLDMINAAAPHLVSIFGEMIESYRETIRVPADPRKPEALEELVRQFLDKCGAQTIAAIRPRLLNFCVAELIHPDWVAEMTKARIGKQYQALYEHLVSDRVLRHTFRAVYLGQF